MITFSQRTFWDCVRAMWPPYRKQRKEEIEAAIKYLVEHPEAPCIVGNSYIPDGYGGKDNILQSIIGRYN